MQLLLGLFFFSVLLTTGSALSCETCTSQDLDCTGHKQNCPYDDAVCMTWTAELTPGPPKVQSTFKGCSSKDACKAIEELKGKVTTSQSKGLPAGALVKKIVCSKAPPSFSSFFPAFLGLLLMKLLF